MRTLTTNPATPLLQALLLVCIAALFATGVSHQRPPGLRTAIELLAKKSAVPAAAPTVSRSGR